MRVSVLLFVIGSLMNGPIAMAVPGAMVSVITVTPSNKSHGAKGKGNSNSGTSSTEHPLKHTNPGSSLAPSSSPSSSSSSSPSSSSSSSTSGSNSGLHKQNHPNSPGLHTASNPFSHSNYPVSSSSVNLAGSPHAPGNMLLPLLHPRGREKKIHQPRHSKPITSSDHSAKSSNLQNHAHFKGDENTLLSRVKRRGARGGGFGNAGRKGPRDRLDYRKGGAFSVFTRAHFAWAALVTGPNILLSLAIPFILLT